MIHGINIKWERCAYRWSDDVDGFGLIYPLVLHCKLWVTVQTGIRKIRAIGRLLSDFLCQKVMSSAVADWAVVRLG